VREEHVQDAAVTRLQDSRPQKDFTPLTVLLLVNSTALVACYAASSELSSLA
jgi:hypothetical protein